MKNYKKLMALAVGLLSVGLASSKAVVPVVDADTLDVQPGQSFIHQITTTPPGTANIYTIFENSPFVTATVDSETGLITGTLTADAPVTTPATVINIQMNGYNDDGISLNKNLALSVKAAVKPQILSPLAGDIIGVTRGAPVSIQVEASNIPTSYTLEDSGAGALQKVPTGLTINKDTGLISGVVASTVAFGAYTVKITAANATGTSDAVEFQISVGASGTAFIGSMGQNAKGIVNLSGTAYTEGSSKSGKAILAKSKLNSKVLLEALATANYFNRTPADPAVIPASKGYKIVAVPKPSDLSVIEYYAQSPEGVRTLIPVAYLEVANVNGPSDAKKQYVAYDPVSVLKGYDAPFRTAVEFSGAGSFNKANGAGSARVSGVNDGQ
jgi:hypothetical protein